MLNLLSNKIITDQRFALHIFYHSDIKEKILLRNDLQQSGINKVPSPGCNKRRYEHRTSVFFVHNNKLKYVFVVLGHQREQSEMKLLL